MTEHKSISIADQVFSQLEKDILRGKYKKGEILTELRLSSELGVSRTPVREAVRRLQQEQLLEESGKGSVVIGISLEDTLDMYDIRLGLEGLCAARAAKRISDEELRAMEELLELQRFYTEKSDGDNADKIRNLDSEFHELLYKAGGSRVFLSCLSDLHRKIGKFRRASVSRHKRALNSVKEHEAILEALKNHDSEAAERLTRLHVQNARDSMAEMET